MFVCTVQNATRVSLKILEILIPFSVSTTSMRASISNNSIKSLVFSSSRRTSRRHLYHIIPPRELLLSASRPTDHTQRKRAITCANSDLRNPLFPDQAARLKRIDLTLKKKGYFAMADEEDDEALRLAIELSLQTDQPTPATSADTVIDLISDDDDDLDAPQKIPSRPAISKLQQIKVENLAKSIRSNDESLVSRSMDNSTNIVAKPNVNTENAILAPRPSGSTLLGLDRKQMEQERLARLAASKPGQHGNEAESKKRKAELMSRDDASVPMVGLIVPVGTQGSKLHTTGASTLYAPNYASNRAASRGIQYPHGIVKKTWARGYDRDGSDISIEEVLQKDSLDLAVLSSFQIDSEWIMGKLNDTTKVVWVLQAKSEAEVSSATILLCITESKYCQKENWRDNAPENYRFCFPYSEYHFLASSKC